MHHHGCAWVACCDGPEAYHLGDGEQQARVLPSEAWSVLAPQGAVVLAWEADHHDHGAARPSCVDYHLQDVVGQALEVTQLRMVWLLVLHNGYGLQLDFGSEDCQDPLPTGCDPSGCQRRRPDAIAQ